MTKKSNEESLIGKLAKIKTPEDIKDEGVLLVLRKATQNDKLDWLCLMEKCLNPGEEIEDESKKQFLASDSVFVCLCDEEVNLIERDYITLLTP
jgi:hypothetical protein